MYSATSLEDALIYETDSSAKVLTTEAIVGAKKFAAGLGKHGKFNVNQVAEKEVVEVKLFDSIESNLTLVCTIAAFFFNNQI